jgi:hypothetical protein
VNEEVAMAAKKLSAEELSQTAQAQDNEQDEIDEVLTTLRHLYQKISSPIIRACLEAARSDIAYLADTAEDSEEDDFEDEIDFPEHGTGAA